MNTCLKACIVAASLAGLLIFAEPASAAKGVKKTGERHYRGVVVSVHKAPNGVAGTERLTITTQHHKSKKGLAGANNRARTHTFVVDRRTRISGGTLHKGETVTVAAHGQHADSIVILGRRHARANRQRRTAALQVASTTLAPKKPVHHAPVVPTQKAPAIAHATHHTTPNHPTQQASAAVSQHKPHPSTPTHAPHANHSAKKR